MNSRLERFRTGRFRPVLWILVVVLVTSPWWIQRPEAPRGSLLHRLLGPLATSAASVQWIRANVAWSRGHHADGYALAASAIELAPEAPDFWIGLANHFFHSRASPERESDPETRRLWVEAAFDVLDRGSATAEAHGALSLERGNLLVHLAKYATENVPAQGAWPWPGRPSDLLEAAATAFERAAELGDPDGAEIARGARERAAEARAAQR